MPDWMTQPDPYTGEPWDQPVQGPMPAGIRYEPYGERADVETYNEAGFTIARAPAPHYRCATCGADTTRRVPIAFYRFARHAGEQQFHGEYRAECGACGLARDASDTTTPAQAAG